MYIFIGISVRNLKLHVPEHKRGEGISVVVWDTVGARGGEFDGGTSLQAGRSRVALPVLS